MPSWRTIVNVLSLHALTFSTVEVSVSGAAEPCAGEDTDADTCASKSESYLQKSSFGGRGAAVIDADRLFNAGLSRVTLGKVAAHLLHRVGYEPAESVLQPDDAEKLLRPRLSELRTKCPVALEHGWVMIDAARDTRGGTHWVFQGPRSAGDASTLLVHAYALAGSKPLRVTPELTCQEAGPPSFLEDSKAVPGAPEPITVASMTVAHAADIALSSLKAYTSECNTTVASIEVLSALTEVLNGELVILDAKVFASGAPTDFTYHSLSLMGTIDDAAGDMVWRLEPLAGEGGEDIGWCEVMATCTGGSCESASLLGHDALRRYKLGLGYLLGYSDAGPALEEALLEESRSAATCPDKGPVPTRFDVRDTHSSCFQRAAVLDQRGCGSCWAFSASAALSGRACMQDPSAFDIQDDGTRTQFSVQQVMSCDEGKSGCRGGLPGLAFREYAKGITKMSDYPYMPSRWDHPWHSGGAACQWGDHDKPWRSTDRYYLEIDVHDARRSPEAMMSELYCKGPYSVNFITYENFGAFFRKSPSQKDAVYASTEGTRKFGAHSVALMGYGVKDGVPYWEMMNSWGPEWANDGFFRMLRGQNFCKVESMAPTVGEVVPQDSWWMLDSWGACSNGADGTHSRSLTCHGPGPCNTRYSKNSLKTSTPLVWPDVRNWGTFRQPGPHRRRRSTRLHPAEEAAVSGCGAALCNSSYCNNFGTASWSADTQTCTCTCGGNFVGDTCGACKAGFSGWDQGFCREDCTRDADCGGRGRASGHKWLKYGKYGQAMKSCVCQCDGGYCDPVLFACDFEGGRSLCGMNQASSAVAESWSYGSGSTPTRGTGPSGDHTAGKGHYIFTEATSSPQRFRSFVIETPVLDSTSTATMSTATSLTFWYHMWVQFGTLRVEAYTCNSQWSEVFKADGNKGHQWLQAHVAIPIGTTKVRWNAFTGRTSRGDIAIDDIAWLGSSSDTTTPAPRPATMPGPMPSPMPCPAPAPAPTPNNIVWACDFEDMMNLCGMSYSGSTEQYFTYNAGPTPTRNSGPNGDHSWGGIGHYIYSEGGGPFSKEKHFIIETPVFNSTSTAMMSTVTELTFWYHMYVADYAGPTLSVEVYTGAAWSQVFKIDGNQGYQWHQARVAIPIGTTQVRWNVLTGRSEQSDVAIDDIAWLSVPTGPFPTPMPSPTPSPMPSTFDTVLFACDFDGSTTCGMNFDGSQRYWEKRSGKTPSFGTGPRGDHSSGNGLYMYTEATGRGASKTFIIGTPVLDPTAAATAVTFWYHMYGSDMGTLSVEVHNGAAWSEVFKADGDKGDQWNQKLVPIPSGTTQVRWNALTGPDFKSDIAIDDIAWQGPSP